MQTRGVALAWSVGAGIVWVGLLTLLLPNDSGAAKLLLDRNTQLFLYPFTIQNVMWMVFFVAAGELVVRYLAGGEEQDQLLKNLLPEDEETVLRQKDIGPIHRRVRQSDSEGRYWQQRLLTSVMLQFQSSGSVNQVNAIFNSSMELYQHETELRYNVLWMAVTGFG